MPYFVAVNIYVGLLTFLKKKRCIHKFLKFAFEITVAAKLQFIKKKNANVQNPYLAGGILVMTERHYYAPHC